MCRHLNTNNLRFVPVRRNVHRKSAPESVEMLLTVFTFDGFPPAQFSNRRFCKRDSLKSKNTIRFTDTRKDSFFGCNLRSHVFPLFLYSFFTNQLFIFVSFYAQYITRLLFCQYMCIDILYIIYLLKYINVLILIRLFCKMNAFFVIL